MSESSRHRVTLAQLECLWELLNCNKSLATGFNKSAQARADSRNMWMNAAEMLNSHGDGAVKDWKGWCKYWNDYKSKIKNRLSSLRASNTRTGGGPAETKPLTGIEKKFIQLVGKDFGSGLPGARVEPFHNQIQTETAGPSSAVHCSLSPPQLLHILEEQTALTSSGSLVHLIEESQIPTSISATPAFSNTPTNPQPSPNHTLNPVASGAETLNAPPMLSTPQRSPRRRRMRRREAPITQEMSRRILIELSERRAAHEEAGLELLRALVEEIREIKTILRSRHSASARGDQPESS